MTPDERQQLEAYRALPRWKRAAIILAIRAPRPLGRLIVSGLLLLAPKQPE